MIYKLELFKNLSLDVWNCFLSQFFGGVQLKPCWQNKRYKEVAIATASWEGNKQPPVSKRLQASIPFPSRLSGVEPHRSDSDSFYGEYKARSGSEEEEGTRNDEETRVVAVSNSPEHDFYSHTAPNDRNIFAEALMGLLINSSDFMIILPSAGAPGCRPCK